MCLFDEIRSSTRLDFQLGKEPALVTEARLDMREPQKSSLRLEFNALENLKKGQDKIVNFFSDQSTKSFHFCPRRFLHSESRLWRSSAVELMAKFTKQF